LGAPVLLVAAGVRRIALVALQLGARGSAGHVEAVPDIGIGLVAVEGIPGADDLEAVAAIALALVAGGLVVLDDIGVAVDQDAGQAVAVDPVIVLHRVIRGSVHHDAVAGIVLDVGAGERVVAPRAANHHAVTGIARDGPALDDIAVAVDLDADGVRRDGVEAHAIAEA